MPTEDLPELCCMNAGGPGEGFVSCDKPAASWYQHGDGVCSFCVKHDYVCGTKINPTRELTIKRDDGCAAFVVMGDPSLLGLVMRDVGVEDSTHEGAITFSFSVGFAQTPYAARGRRIEQIKQAAATRSINITETGNKHRSEA